MTNVSKDHAFSVSLDRTDTAFQERWNSFVADAEYGHLQQGYEYTRFKAVDGWSAGFVWTESSGVITSGSNILWRNIGRLPLTVAMAPRGPLWRRDSISAVATLLEKLDEYCRNLHIVFCRINPGCLNDDFLELKPFLPHNCRELRHVWSYWNLPRPVMQLDLRENLDEIIGRMHSGFRRDFRRAERQGVSIRFAGPGEVHELARLMSDMGVRKSIHVQSTEYFQRLLQVFTNNRVTIIAAEFEGKTIASILVAYLGNTAYHLYGAFSYDFRDRCPNEALHVAMIRWAKEHECDILDLGGTCTDWPPIPDNKGYGVYSFKKKLGAQAVLTAPYCDLVYRSNVYLLARLIENIGMPLILEAGLGKIKVIIDRIRNGM